MVCAQQKKMGFKIRGISRSQGSFKYLFNNKSVHIFHMINHTATPQVTVTRKPVQVTTLLVCKRGPVTSEMAGASFLSLTS